MNILIAGCSGEIGRYLAARLPQKGHSVVILDRAIKDAVAAVQKGP